MLLLVMYMKCDNELCIYEKDGLCSLREIELDIVGLCKDCIYVDIDEEYLYRQKETMIKRLNKNG